MIVFMSHLRALNSPCTGASYLELSIYGLALLTRVWLSGTKSKEYYAIIYLPSLHKTNPTSHLRITGHLRSMRFRSDNISTIGPATAALDAVNTFRSPYSLQISPLRLFGVLWSIRYFSNFQRLFLSSRLNFVKLLQLIRRKPFRLCTNTSKMYFVCNSSR